ncbi:MAG TPA: tRNA (adenosine(37)-N6)-threonylcarbamoyltransferase complex ATPase subunit type 1 TsaE [Steroidobacteraceae bacterium]|jgi:tRNA threonylcarbamoyladenosine biosynthesis protein TsaE|nr:tRNA (adenosine(37)-N6)-threonylcarbamoyltransferase complex ATPase subunit type 1 TsaE [Steroidobacteraceae bacterium]
MPTTSMDFDLADSSVTEALGGALARTLPSALPAGAVLYLQGDLGTGKTTCARALLRALGVTGLVRSPTYTLVEIYTLGALTCVHVDLYRLQTLIEVDELGLRDLVGTNCLLLAEWPEKGAVALPPADVSLALSHAGNARRAQLLAMTALGADWLQNMGRDTSLSSYVSNLT